MQFLIPLKKKKYNTFWSPIKTSLMEHFKTRGREKERESEAMHARTATRTVVALRRRVQRKAEPAAAETE